MEKQKAEDAVISECSPASKVIVNGDNVDETATEKSLPMNGESCVPTSSSPQADDEKMNEMFTDDIVNDMKQELGDDSKHSGENKDEFTDQCDQKDSEALEMKMKNSEKTEALQLFQQGKRNLLIKDFDAAVETLASACEKFSSIYGELSTECGDVFMTYGHALIELWRYEESNKREDDESNGTSKPVNNDTVEAKKVQESDAVTTESNGEQVVEEQSETNETTAAEVATNGEENEVMGETAENEESTTKSNDEVAQPPNDDTIEDESAEENDDEVDCDEDEEVDNLQLAWEIFETARNIYMKHNDETNLAKVHTKLGEISIASGNYELAIDDLKKSLSILNKALVAKPRQIADAHFQLYSAYSANYNFDLAEIELRNAKNILEEQLRVLDGKLTDLAAESDEAKQINSEKKDLEELTKDMREKLVELNSSKRQVVTAISTTIRNKMENQKPSPSIGEIAGSSGVSLAVVSNSSSNVPVNNISHLVRKKPKAAVNGEKTGEEKNMTNDAVVLKSNGNVSVAVEETVKTNGNVPVQEEDIVKSDVVHNDSPTCKRKADDESEETESKAKKQCVS